MGFIPPVGGAGGGKGEIDPYLTQFKLLWDRWWNNPTKKNAEDLLNFLKDPAVARDFKKNAEGKMAPFPTADFLHDYQSAITTLEDWIDDGCQRNKAQIPSQFISYVWQWEIGPRQPTGYASQSATSQFEEFWEIWSQRPTQKNGETLLAFLEDPKIERSMMSQAQQKQIDFPEAQFGRDYRYAVSSLRDWLESGCDPLGAPAVHNLLSTLHSWIS